jgi:multiple sugar transport system permease protein
MTGAQTTRQLASIAAEPPPAAGLRERLLFSRQPLEAGRRLFLVCMTAPVVLYVLTFAVYPAVIGISYSFYRYNLLKPDRTKFVGFDNYIRIWSDPVSARAVVNTLAFMAGTVGLEFLLGFGLALLLWRESRFNRICLALILVPVAVTPLATGLIFRGLLTPDYGPVGYWARTLGLSGEHGFLGTPGSALPTIIAMNVWQWTPLMALILLAGLKSIPSSFLEAAEIDGATAWQRFTTIIVPVSLPSILLALLLRLIDASMVFDTIYVTTNGGPNNATEVLMIQAVKEGLEFFNVGAASAISVFMLFMVALIASVFFVLINRYDRQAAP